MSSYSHSFIRVESDSGEKFARLIDDEYDIFVSFSSWDARCVSITEEATKVSFYRSVIVDWEFGDPKGLQAKHCKAICRWAEARSSSTILIKEKSINLDAVREAVLSSVADVYIEKKGPIKVLLDMSSCPRYFAMVLPAAFINYQTSAQIDCIYSEAEYTKTGIGIAFTEGTWRPIAIPTLEGSHKSDAIKHVVLSMGFEGDKALRTLQREDPDKLTALIPDPGNTPDYTTRCLDLNRETLRQFPNATLLKAPAGDAALSFSCLAGFVEKFQNTNNFLLIACGTKPHALACALTAVCLPCATAIYILPEKHSVVETEHIGKRWRYRIIDVSR